jgi:CRP-like cAMP-binding protein
MTITPAPAVVNPLSLEERQALFPFLAGEEGALLTGFLEYREYAAADLVLKNGEPSVFLAFVARGKLAIKKETAFPGKHILVAILEPGALVGDFVAGSGQGGVGTVAALEDSGLWVMTLEQMDSLFAEHPLLGRKLLARLIQVLSIRLGKAYDRLAGLL